ncbi:DNA primase OS=Tsukamurella paurometabola (strain ATCC 8368 / DSM / CCUG 35730 / CIP 100753/ JCM 10117 / KCTC 9821 / NBRC 16120 / NCIMB 702349 / NCTC 13040)OX=521096 GN=dnaG PE=3 SV=1 [Tsukamurella paurometabola]|uniref:DNA primase n=1 Tax=Tsukamurella paurometabola (strain ATCC 8368 / DSM 20162 / CCUG 35730 / CIP 100753 / JCM 10117 / KCTC 9821 / NBRC 16120 / NCIMB 702349 / NCTC 13040) TaxID=521096 RepID=D5USR6_TSUPD|nr:DNA primase [Tsukamurella paurometabola]ADG79337.1 DNA primase [Tsukamurella paurometabola DSM 20162]SUP35145.1 DNA primase [Tsukamurella paurometabola]
MVGRIPERDIAAIRDRARIEDVVGEYVALRPAGVGSMKGLCPFHDEKTPSFHVRPTQGFFHCFGCGEGGDVISFLQKIEHVPFVEAVEQLADKVGIQISYEGGTPGPKQDRGTRMRLVAANAAAQKFYAEQLRTPEAETARQYLQDRDFTAEDAEFYGCGYAPSGWDTMTKALLRQGFEVKELEAAGLTKQGQRGPIDRFHRRLLWPIKNLGGDVIGFGARKLFDDDNLGKYMNTTETMLYKKSQVLFGLDHAKKHIAKGHQVVVVEGYTDVMAMHAAGVETAVASCGTAFGEDHVSLVRRLMMDDSYFRGEVIYTFDGDEAGRAAAMKAFDGDQKIAGRTFVAVAPDGMDPCELRQKHGDEAVRDLIAQRVPMFEFAVKTLISEFDLDTAEGRVHALRRSVPVVARIKDMALRDEYARQLAGWVGWDDVGQVLRRVREESARIRRGEGRPGPGAPAPSNNRFREPENPVPQARPTGPQRPNPTDPVLWVQREVLKCALQAPALAGTVFDALSDDMFTDPAYRAIRLAIEGAGGIAAGLGGAEWVDTVVRHADGPVLEALVTELAVEPLEVQGEPSPRYVESVLARLQEVWVGGQVADLKSKLKRMSPNADDDYNRLFGDLVALESYRQSLLKLAVGDTGY